MFEYWTSTKSKANLNPRSYETPEREAYLRANVGVDVHLLAKDIGVDPKYVIAWQRRLGLRPCVPSGRAMGYG